MSRADILADPHRTLDAEQAAARLEDFVARRERREPVSQILGRKGFWTLMLKVGAGGADAPAGDRDQCWTSCCRPSRRSGAFSVLDLGVGSGAILLVDPGRAADGQGPGRRRLRGGAGGGARQRRPARASSGRAGAAARPTGPLGLGDAAFDLVVSNPPYIPTADIEALRAGGARPRAAAGARRRRRTAWTPIARWRRRSCACCSPAACSRWRSASARRAEVERAVPGGGRAGARACTRTLPAATAGRRRRSRKPLETSGRVATS